MIQVGPTNMEWTQYVIVCMLFAFLSSLPVGFVGTQLLFRTITYIFIVSWFTY